ncbi:MAG: hypothetical protein RL291_741, partial [Pseudomonadota bacterium]
MLDTAITVVTADADFDHGQIHFETRASRASAALQLVWLIPAVAGLALPLSLVLTDHVALA